ncbi:MAG: hypothetical protein SGBAC_009982 [Bacillariaceae sp.]
MSTGNDSDSVQSQAESSMSSYVHVPSYSSSNNNSTNNQIADEENTIERADEMNQDSNSENIEDEKMNYPIEPMTRELKNAILAAATIELRKLKNAMLAATTNLDLRVLPREDLIALSGGFLPQASNTISQPRDEKMNYPIEPMILELENAMLAATTNLDLRILPREDLIALSGGFLAQASKTIFRPLVVIGYKIVEQSKYDQIRQLGFDQEEDDDSNCFVWRTLSRCLRPQLTPTRTNPIPPPKPYRLLRRTSESGNERKSAVVPPVVNTSETNTAMPRHLWMVATVIRNRHPEMRSEQLTIADVGAAHCVLPLACLDTTSGFENIKKDHVHCLARRLTSILNAFLENDIGVDIARDEETIFASRATRSGQQTKEHKWGRHWGTLVHLEADLHTIALISILNESSVNTLKIINEQETVRSDLRCFLCRREKLRQKLFVGFNVAKESQFEEIQMHGFQCGPGFHLCKTIENAYSFWTFRKKKSAESSSLEHLWIVLGTNVPPSTNNPNAAGLSGTEVLPLACIDVPSMGNDQDALDYLLADLTQWTQQLT